MTLGDYMITRQRIGGRYVRIEGTNPGNPDPASRGPFYHVVYQPSLSSVISYWHQARKVGKRQTNPCEHVVVNCLGLRKLATYKGDRGDNIFMNPPMCMPVSEHYFAELSPPFPDTLHSDLNLEAFSYFADAFPERISFSESVLGIRQLGDLIPRIGENIMKTISNGILTEKFGWENLLSDLSSLKSLSSAIDQRVAYLRSIYRKQTRLHFSRVLPGSLGSFPPYSIEDSRGLRFDVVDPVSTFHYSATAWVFNTLNLDGWFGTYRALIGALGLDNPLKAFWVNIPLSFVVDWFFKIDKHLDALTKFRDPDWSVYAITNTTKVVTRFRVKVIHRDLISYPDYSEDGGQVSISVYKRSLGLPVHLIDFEGGLSPNQLVLFLALIGAR